MGLSLLIESTDSIIIKFWYTIELASVDTPTFYACKLPFYNNIIMMHTCNLVYYNSYYKHSRGKY